jgi:hypothetical protein
LSKPAPPDTDRSRQVLVFARKEVARNKEGWLVSPDTIRQVLRAGFDSPSDP